MSDIDQAMDAIVAVQEKLAISDPSVEIAKAWKFFPPQSTSANIAVPAFINEWTFRGFDTETLSLLEQLYTVHMQLLVADADLSRAAEIATKFMPAIVTAFTQAATDEISGVERGGVTLGGTVTSSTLRGGNPTLVRVERSERAYIGLDLFLDLQIAAGWEFS